GLVPFIRAGGGYRYCVMKPVPRHKELGGPAMQLCKGTRMHWRDGQGWCDIREKSTKEARMESLAATAVREGREELGLTLEAIHRLFELGFYDFASARTGHRKEMYMFAAEVSDPGLLLPMENIRATTAERGWLTLAQFEVVGRDDHRYILRDIEAR